MTEQARTSRVLIGLIVSMTLGAVVLMALDTGAVQKGPFSLAAYLAADPVADVVANGITLDRNGWHRIEVFYSGVAAENARELAILSGLDGHDLNAHFVVYTDGARVERTPRWESQRQCVPDGAWQGSTDTIRICVVADGFKNMPTRNQRARIGELITTLSKEFKVNKNVVWPVNWRM